MLGHMKNNTKETNKKTTEIQSRYSAIKALAMFRYTLERLDNNISDLIVQARRARDTGEDGLYLTLKKKLRLCLINKKTMVEMMSRLELSLEMESMDRMIENYNSCMEVFENTPRDSKRIKDLGRDPDSMIEYYAGICKELRSDPIKNMEGEAENIVSDEEIESMLEGNIISETGDSDDMIDSKIRLIKSKMDSI